MLVSTEKEEFGRARGRTQNPPVLSTLGVQLPLPAPTLTAAPDAGFHANLYPETVSSNPLGISRVTVLWPGADAIQLNGEYLPRGCYQQAANGAVWLGTA